MHSTSAIRQAARTIHRLQPAPTRFLRSTTQRGLHGKPTPPYLLRKPALSTTITCQHRRYDSTSAAVSRPLSDRTESSESDDIAARKAQEPAYEMTFTCRKCEHRSSHRITKQAYHHGTTLVTCPGCKNKHLISDHLKIFSDKGVTVEDILKEKGELMKKGRMNENGDIEFYDENEAKV